MTCYVLKYFKEQVTGKNFCKQSWLMSIKKLDTKDIRKELVGVRTYVVI